MHIWIEGVPGAHPFDGLSRHLSFLPAPLDLGTLRAPIARPRNMNHPNNKFGNPYDTHSDSSLLRNSAEQAFLRAE